MSTLMQLERSRLLDAMLEELVEKGYEGAEVEAAIHRARLSGEEWCSRFPDKDACLIAAFEQLTERLRAAVQRGCGVDGQWPTRVYAGVRELLGELASRPELAEALTRTFASIGVEAQLRYQAFVESLAPLLREGRKYSGMAKLPREVEMLAVGAAEAIVYDEVASSRTAQLPTMGPEILFSLLVPFVGPASAAAEMERARRDDERSEIR